MHKRFVCSKVLKIRHHFHHHVYRIKYKWDRNQKKKYGMDCKEKKETKADRK